MRQGFTLIELLTVIAIIGILAAIIIPTVGKVRDSAQKSVAGSNLRQIGQAAQIFATDNRDALPKWTVVTAGATMGQVATTAAGETVDGYALALAVGGGLNDATIWVLSNDQGTNAVLTPVSTIFTPNGTNKDWTTGFNALSLGFGVVLGLTTADAPTTPVAFTRGIIKSTDGKWTNDGVYGTDGGHIVFLGGNVQYFKNLGATDAAGELINSIGKKTWKLTDTTKKGASTKKFVEETPAGANGTATVGTGPDA